MSQPIRIDLISDTGTRPTPGMRRAMAEAEVGDEQRGEDPSVLALCERVADLLGQEAALFLPSGTMCNQIAILLHCRPGDEVIAAESAHIVGTEGAGAAVLAGSFVRPIATSRGIFTGDDVAAAVRAPSAKTPRSRLVEVEQTSNRGGGAVWPLETLRGVARAAKAHGLALHMDGARLLNASVATGVPAADYAGLCDSAWLDLSKGLGCPAGGVLAGPADFIKEAWVWKFRLGGAMRQAGILAAAGVYALDNHVDRMAEDHDNARRLWDGVAALPGVRMAHPDVPTNMVFFDVSETGRAAADIGADLRGHGVRIGIQGPDLMRAVTHLDVDRAGIDGAVQALGAVLAA
ncbi:MAG: threonine aldolase family protein [Hyphomicrobiales bacterium]|nr:threonine aldolase family protein [Hyphomicrobiales bacterium]MCP5371014.1 threonine aldolase family protein [Hyphomicrobiales bacterium]